MINPQNNSFSQQFQKHFTTTHRLTDHMNFSRHLQYIIILKIENILLSIDIESTQKHGYDKILDINVQH
jgi:hypothetical protein